MSARLVRSRWTPWLVLLGILIPGCTSGTERQASQSQTQPNILLLVAEDLSPRLGSWDDAVANTPNLDALAATGIRYTRVFTTAGVCAPSRAALVTGQHQISFGAQHMRSSTGPLGPYYAQPPAGLRAFPELLRRSGYFTFTDAKLDYQFSGIQAGSGPFTLWDREAVGLEAVVERQPGQPFFGLINFMQTHESGVMRMDGAPRNPTHAAMQRMRSQAGLIAPAITDPAAVPLPPYYPDLPAVRVDLARHYDNVARMDAQVGAVLQALKAKGLRDNTIVIWTTDHGDGLPRAKRELFDSGIQVPMIVHIPSKLRQASLLPQGGEQDRLVSFVDLAPTILQLAGVKAPEYLHGTSFLTGKRDYVLASRDRIDEVMDRQRAVRDRRFKYIRSWYPEVAGGHVLAFRDNLDMVRAMRNAFQRGALNAAQRRWFEAPGAEQLYDLQTDPFELRNLAADDAYRGTLVRMRQLLAEALQRVGDTGALSEAEMRAKLLRNGEVPETPAPQWRHSAGRIVLSHTEGASIGYRPIGDTHWRLYTGPIEREAIEARAVRYGWRASPVIAINQ